MPCIIVIIAWHLSLCIDVTSEAVYKIVAEPIPEPQAGEPQAETAAEPEGGVTVDAPRRWMDGPDVHYPEENVRQANII